MAYNSARGYSLYDTIMRNRSANRRAGVSTTGAPTTQTLTDKSVGGTRLPGPGAVRLGTTGPTYSEFMDQSKAFISTEDGVRALGYDEVEAGLTVGETRLTSGEAAAQSACVWTLGHKWRSCLTKVAPARPPVFSACLA